MQSVPGCVGAEAPALGFGLPRSGVLIPRWCCSVQTALGGQSSPSRPGTVTRALGAAFLRDVAGAGPSLLWHRTQGVSEIVPLEGVILRVFNYLKVVIR